ncbi:uncharacterized protein LOC133194534 [Saccostrea echinata]|uniref:uncharacterized protein LOC133194534 n=1 Tax=Saccostrea echinata TaxID=191078 RepID=UPI002A7FBCC5|nr:uncharacterized protein LOC133194534 [Saccostrea echinata]
MMEVNIAHTGLALFLVLLRLPLTSSYENISNTPVPPKEQIYSFRLKYRTNVDCVDEAAKNAFLGQIRIKVISRLIELAKEYPSMCNKENFSECFQSVKVDLKACETTNRRKRSMDFFDVDINVEIPATSPTVEDSSESSKVVRTESILQEDIETQKTDYSPQGVTLLNSTYVGKNVTCANGTILSDDNKNCEACKEGTYHDTTTDVCKKCPKSFYQNSTGQTSCEACPGSGNMYTLSEGSTSKTQCVEKDTSQAGLITGLILGPVAIVIGLGASVHFIRRRWFSTGADRLLRS